MAKIVEVRRRSHSKTSYSVKDRLGRASLTRTSIELAASIDKVGLLQPIVVCQSTQDGKWEILLGQRRLPGAQGPQARQISRRPILDERVDEAEAKAISITENLIRQRLSGAELIDGITFLYNKYGDRDWLYTRQRVFRTMTCVTMSSIHVSYRR